MIVIDTHILLWWVSGYKSLSAAAAKAIKDTLGSGSRVIVSSISAWEIAMLIEQGRLILNMDLESWLTEINQIDSVHMVSVDNEVSIKATMLPGEFHQDIADRMIVATARKLAVPLVTADAKIINYAHVKTIW